MIRLILFLYLLLISTAAFAGTDCRIIDKVDHVELVCVGDEKSAPAPASVFRPAAQPAERYQAPGHAAVQASPPAVQPAPQTKYNSVKAFHNYLQKDQQWVSDFADKRAYRMRMIQEEMRNTPPPPVQEQPMSLNGVN